MLALRIDFLNGVYHAADPSAHRSPEWPPHPDRVFQALVAGAYRSGANPAPLQALEDTAPELAFGSWPPSLQGATLYVPAAYQAVQSRVVKYDPTIVDIRDPVYLLWPQAPDELRAQITPIATAVDYLGRAKTPVELSLVAEVPTMPHHLVPSSAGDYWLRIPQQGRLAELDAAFAIGRRAPVAALAGYRDARDRTARSPWRELLVLRPRQLLDLRRAAQLTDALRTAVLSQAGDGASPLLHGHAGDHAAWTLIPDVGHPHARGHALGLGLWLPRVIDPAARTDCVVPLARVDHIMLGAHRIALGLPSPAQHTPKGLQPSTWTSPNRDWTSVTPVVLDRHPKRGQCIEDLIADSVVMAGFPRPVAVTADQTSAITAVPPARDFRPRSRGHWTHVALSFAQPVAGPLLIGKDRHFGLGLMRPMRSRHTEVRDAGLR